MKKKSGMDSPMQDGFPVKEAKTSTPVLHAPVGEKYRGDVNKRTREIFSPMSGMATPATRKK